MRRAPELVVLEALMLELEVPIGQDVYRFDHKSQFCIAGLKNRQGGQLTRVWRKIDLDLWRFVCLCRDGMTEEQVDYLEIQIAGAKG